VPHEQRIGHYLASGTTVPEALRRFAEILHLAQETKDWALVALSMFPVFEQYFDGFIRDVSARSGPFKAFVDGKYNKNMKKKKRNKRVIFIGERIDWISTALTHLGYDPKSAETYIDELKKANEERIQVVHSNKKQTAQDAMSLARRLINTFCLCETALGNELPYVVALCKLK
jgi:hypothetical protein